MTADSRRRRSSTSRIRGIAARVSESVESRLWPLPVAAIVFAVGLGILLPRIDLVLDASLPTGVDSVVFNGGAETARSVLSSIAGSLITATSLTFSLTVVALQLASSQASPRVLRLFARDRRVHATLAMFLGTFAYALTVLRSIRDPTDDIPGFVPRIAVTAGFVLTLISVIMLVFFLAHLAAQLRVETILKEIHADTDKTIDLVGGSNAAAPAHDRRVRIPAHKTTVTSRSSGFITSLDRDTLLSCAQSHHIVVEENRVIGENIVSGTPLAYWWPHDEDGASSEPSAIEKAIRSAYTIGYERTAAQDIDYGIQQIVDIGVRALSPGINDPTTAVHTLGHLSAITTRIVALPTLPAGLADHEGQLCVITASRSPRQAVEAALSQMRHYGAGDPAVVTRFLQVIDDLAHTCNNPEVHAELRVQLSALDLQIRTNTADPSATEQLLTAIRTLALKLTAAGASEQE
ncbi:DUF2254 domain-containing protein [Herbiconiux sp. VKM Ac-2851]|uniref:DUF2254 domain-containing protein n=1 Tax=Herbiconiux sp. VKM Ac-2851 TaxID=2739025 RepID=UPI001564F1A7|nr:DUF2254 domain-containing protein [Herbiconiux sp. VKM Ac-2851]